VSPRRPATPAFQLPLLPAAEVNPASGTCQRWSGGTHRWRRRRDGGFDRSRYRAVRIGNAVAKRVVEREHYLHTFPAARLSWGLTRTLSCLASPCLGCPATLQSRPTSSPTCRRSSSWRSRWWRARG
jgi:hypothetical protein